MSFQLRNMHKIVVIQNWIPDFCLPGLTSNFPNAMLSFCGKFLGPLDRCVRHLSMFYIFDSGLSPKQSKKRQMKFHQWWYNIVSNFALFSRKRMLKPSLVCTSGYFVNEGNYVLLQCVFGNCLLRRPDAWNYRKPPGLRLKFGKRISKGPLFKQLFANQRQWRKLRKTAC